MAFSISKLFVDKMVVLFDTDDLVTLMQVRGVLAAVDCTKQKSLAEKFEIRGFPTGKLIPYGAMGDL